MVNKENVSAMDRGFFSELTESPIAIHSLLIYVDSCNPNYPLQINGEELWHWREVRVARLGYKLEESSHDRIGSAIATNIRNFWRKIDGISNGKREKNNSR